MPLVFGACESKNTRQTTDNSPDKQTKHPKYDKHYAFVQVQKMASEVLEIAVDSIKYETKLSNLGLKKEINDIDYMELVMHIEAEFEIEISDEEADKFTTIGEICNYIDKKMSR